MNRLALLAMFVPFIAWMLWVDQVPVARIINRWRARRRTVVCPTCFDVQDGSPCPTCGLWGHVTPRRARAAVSPKDPIDNEICSRCGGTGRDGTAPYVCWTCRGTGLRFPKEGEHG
jgi:ribosomal protein L40E